MRTDAQRIGAYLSKTTPATVSLKVAAVLALMKTGFASAANDLVPIEMQVQGILNAETPPIPTIKYPFYLNFAREIWAKRHEGIDGTNLNSVGQSLHDKYEAYGLTSAVMIEIADTVFNVSVI